MSIGISPLLEKRQTIGSAERTLRLVMQALNKGDLRLAVSRGITAIIQAASASVGAKKSTVKRAGKVIQEVRNIIQGAVLTKISQSVGLARGAMIFTSNVKGKKEKGIFIAASNPRVLSLFLHDKGIPFSDMQVSEDPPGIFINARSAKKARKFIQSAIKLIPEATRKALMRMSS